MRAKSGRHFGRAAHSTECPSLAGGNITKQATESESKWSVRDAAARKVACPRTICHSPCTHTHTQNTLTAGSRTSYTATTIHSYFIQKKLIFHLCWRRRKRRHVQNFHNAAPVRGSDSKFVIQRFKPTLRRDSVSRSYVLLGECERTHENKSLIAAYLRPFADNHRSEQLLPYTYKNVSPALFKGMRIAPINQAYFT